MIGEYTLKFFHSKDLKFVKDRQTHYLTPFTGVCRFVTTLGVLTPRSWQDYNLQVRMKVVDEVHEKLPTEGQYHEEKCNL